MKRRLLIHLFALSILIITSVRLFSTTQAQSNVIYVNVNATGFNDGTSWENAFLDLPLALASAQPGDEVWVAAGIYTPNILYPPAPTPTPLPGGPWNRAASIVLKNGVAIYGGFNGTESLLSERDWTTNLTVLSGDLNRDDGPDFTNNDENAYHVVTGSEKGDLAVKDDEQEVEEEREDS